MSVVITLETPFLMRSLLRKGFKVTHRGDGQRTRWTLGAWFWRVFSCMPPDLAKIERFKALARELGCDEDEAAFEAALKKVAASGPVPKREPKKRQPKG